MSDPPTTRTSRGSLAALYYPVCGVMALLAGAGGLYFDFTAGLDSPRLTMSGLALGWFLGTLLFGVLAGNQARGAMREHEAQLLRAVDGGRRPLKEDLPEVGAVTMGLLGGIALGLWVAPHLKGIAGGVFTSAGGLLSCLAAGTGGMVVAWLVCRGLRRAGA